MSGAQGLMIAAALGVVGAVCNWFYVDRLAEKKEKVSFVVIDKDAQINVGDRFKEEHFARVDIPKENATGLLAIAVQWNDRQTAIGLPAPRRFGRHEILLAEDLKTPGYRDLSDLLAEDEVALWVSVSAANFVPEMVNPGDEVSFEVPQIPGGAPAVTTSRELQAQPTEMIGPFRILSLGTRTGKRELRRAAGLSSGPEHLISVSVRFKDGKLEAKADRLSRALRLTGNKALGVVLHSAKRSSS